MNIPHITVFTAAYNRANLIPRLYESLKAQSYKDFEWIVVDDGSKDDTPALFENILKEKNTFEIKYKRVENGGKHRAINTGLEMANGDLFFILDSDDFLTDTALELVDRVEKTIPENEKENFAGVCGLKGFSEKIAVGSTFHNKEFLDITYIDREKNNITGDKAEIFYTDILKKYPFPCFEGENFLSECIVWNRIAADGYKLRFFNEIIYICDYLDDGLSVNCSSCFERSPQGYALMIRESIKLGKATGIEKWKLRRNYYNQFKKILPKKVIAKNLEMNPIELTLRVLGMRIFYKIYR